MRDSSDRGDGCASTPLAVRARCARMDAAAAEEFAAAMRGGRGSGSGSDPASCATLPPARPLTQFSIASDKATELYCPRRREGARAEEFEFLDTPRAPVARRIFIGDDGEEEEEPWGARNARQPWREARQVLKTRD